MAKKNEVAVVGKKAGDLVEITDSGKPESVDPFAMVLDLPADALVGRAVEALNVAERLNIGAGLCLLKARELCSTESVLFDDFLKNHNFPRPRAYELMAIADVLQRATPEDRKRLMQQPKTTLIGLARMDDEVRQQLLDTGKLDERLTLNEYKALLERKDAELATRGSAIEKLTAQVRTAELTGRKALDVQTPLTVAQVRREAASYAQDALACVHGFTGMANRLVPLDNEPSTRAWVKPAALSMVSLLVAVQDAVAYQLSELVSQFELDVELPSKAELHLATPGPEEAELIRRAMTGVLVGFETRQSQVAYAQYQEQREANPSKGAPRKAPKVTQGTTRAGGLKA
ncbi:hypothetical protein [Rhodoferax fermentans]|uniref:DUF3102 domain-containing protein n=1 Tax=Rhodoferax fermentans TaxID=28066 RepID=A0A1T1ANX5_RHOFE|nr:hypothetical protein [Rhodoferax fermentans]MBK1683414.1 hypothetical protein [Rhodoferax fermentans]OOV05840.1 hypothetical protein RF819_03150 [Rhodoferax fermentans]